MTAIGGPVRIVFSYSHRDEGWRDLIERHLNVLATQRIAEIWSYGRIGAGEPWERETLEAFDSAHLAILLISPDFLGSQYIMNIEVPRILDRHRSGELAVVPVYLRPCLWEAVSWLRKIQMRPRNGVPLSSLRGWKQEAEMARIAKEIWEILVPPAAKAGQVGAEPPCLPCRGCAERDDHDLRPGGAKDE
ncbi:MAG TPA: TIR domain-containing protein [Thermoanaerobaculia bacterium]|nr:TIR domain-containing protein [Thermoanaerobaculia bacterium]